MLQSGQRRALSSGSRTLACKFFWPGFNVVAFMGATLCNSHSIVVELWEKRDAAKTRLKPEALAFGLLKAPGK